MGTPPPGMNIIAFSVSPEVSQKTKKNSRKKKERKNVEANFLVE
jgi:hypothetical protein